MLTTKIITLLIILIFYITYLTKMFIQNKHGIKTDQMGKGNKPKKTLIIEIILKIFTYSIIVIELISIILKDKNNLVVFVIGTIFSFICVIIFIISIITMKDSWRVGIQNKEKTNLITNGIYKLSRNPAFLGFYLLYIGVLISFFNIIHLIFVVITISILHLQILQEELFLEKTFKDEYLNYKKKTRRYLGIKFRGK